MMARETEEKYGNLMDLLKKAEIYSEFLTDQLPSVKHIVPTASNQDDDVKRRKCENAQEMLIQPNSVTGMTLKNYQLIGMKWLCGLYENGMNGILADEMGLGKTIQTLSFLAFIREKGVNGPFLIIGPLSCLNSWMDDAKAAIPSLPISLYYGNQDERKKQWKAFSPLLKNSSKDAPVILTTFEIIMRDVSLFKKISWKIMIIDEGHRIKNLNCKLLKQLKQLPTENRYLLTGTPLQNNLTELWSLLNFILPNVFDDLDLFKSWFQVDDLDCEKDQTWLLLSEGARESLITKLHSILSPFLLRRLKEDVDRNIPKKKEFVVYCGMSELQLSLYKAAIDGSLREKVQETLNNHNSTDEIDTNNAENDSIIHVEGSLQNLAMQLRKICNHPFIFGYPRSIEDKIEDISNLRSKKIISTTLLQSSGKLRIFDQLLNALLKEKHKILVFSQMTKVLDVLSIYLESKNLKYCRIDGSVSHDLRGIQVKLFNNNPDTKIFLLTTRSGGLGMNLTVADTVILYDSDWNPQMDLQAQDRVHRIGQNSPVAVYRLITRHSIEEKMLSLSGRKRKFEKLVLVKDNFKGDLSITKLSLDEWKKLLEENTNELIDLEKDKLGDDELKNLLDRT